MDYKTIENMLERYFAGETSLQEEAQLRSYFQQAEIDPQLETYRPLFNFFVDEKAGTTSEDFDQRWEAPPIRQAKMRMLRPFVRWASIAAMIVLSIGAWWWLSPSTIGDPPPTAAIDWSQFEPDNEEEALQLTKAALLRTSTQLNLGAKQAAQQLRAVKKLSDPIN